MTRIWCRAHHLDLVSYGVHHEQHCQGEVLRYYDCVHHSFNPSIEYDCRNENNLPSNCQPMAVNSQGNKMVQDSPSTVAFAYCIKASRIGTIASLVGFIAGYAALCRLHVRYLLFHSRLYNVVGVAASCIERPRQFVKGGRWSDRSAHCQNVWGSGSINPCY